MSQVVHTGSFGARLVALLISAAAVAATASGCAAPTGCIGGIGICKKTVLPPRYVIIDPSGSQADLADRQVTEVRAIASGEPAELTLVLLGERPSTSTVVTRVALPRIDQSDPNAVATRTELLAKLESVVRRALAQRTNASDQFGALELVHDDAQQRGAKPGYDVFVLGDSEPCVPGVCWTHDAPLPNTAVKQVQTAYSALAFAGEEVTFVVGGDTSAEHKSPAYVARLSAADLAVCRWAGAQACKTATEVAEVPS